MTGERVARPVMVALLESQPVPAIFAGDLTRGVLANSAAARFMIPTEVGPRVLADDGTDLWTIIVGRAIDADPFYDVSIRLRTLTGESVQTSLAVVPVSAGGALAAAMVFVLNVPAERIHEGPHRISHRHEESLDSVVEQVGRMLHADSAYVLEFNEDVSPQAVLRAHWSADGTPPPETFALNGTPSGSFQGRRLVIVPSGVAASYPMANHLAEYESYAGVALTNGHGEHVGTLAAVWRRPIADKAGTAGALTIAAVSATRALRAEVARRELRESEQRYGSVFEGSAVPILLVEPVTTQVVDANPSACEFYGFSHDEFLSMSVLQVDANAAEALKAELERAMASNRGHFVGQHILSQGRLRDVEVTIGPIRVGGRKLLYFMVNDITERKRIEAELERSKRELERTVGQRTKDLMRANTELQQASMTRDLVVTNLVQELRTSVQTINGFSDLLLEGMAGTLTEEQRRQVEMVKRAGMGLAEFATTLVESGRAHRSDHMTFHEEFDVGDVVESVLLGLASFAEDKGLTVRFEAPEQPIMVRTDRYKAQQVLLSLLSNAIRYTEHGSVTARVRRGPGEIAVVEVTDTGVGMTSEMLAHVFDEPEATSAKVGIGLPASQQIARLLGGIIEVSSEPGVGSTFRFLIPGSVSGERTGADV